MKHRALVVTAFVSTLAAGAFAQDPGETGLSPVVGVGNRVRLESSAVRGRMQGLVVALEDDTLTLATDNGVPVRVPSKSITSVEISLGRRRNVLQGLGAGAVGGLLFGLVAPVHRYDCGPETSNFCSRDEAIRTSALGMGIIGAVVGTFIRSDRWAVVPLGAPGPQARHGLSAGLAVAMRF